MITRIGMPSIGLAVTALTWKGVPEYIEANVNFLKTSATTTRTSIYANSCPMQVRGTTISPGSTGSYPLKTVDKLEEFLCLPQIALGQTRGRRDPSISDSDAAKNG
jgi:hypothetical protein